MFLIDTDVLSALSRRPRDPTIEAWFARQRDSQRFLSVSTISTIERGIALRQRTEPAFAATLAAWLDQVLSAYGERILAFDLATARRWGHLSASLGNDSADLQIAATALEHGLTVVTRNGPDFVPTGVDVVNPFVAVSDTSTRHAKRASSMTSRHAGPPSCASNARVRENWPLIRSARNSAMDVGGNPRLVVS